MQEFDLIVVGHVAYDENRTRHGTRTVAGGAAYFTALPASIYSRKIGLVARIGEDFDMGILKRPGIDLSGVHLVQGGKSSRFYNNYLTEDGSLREWQGELNVGADLVPEDMPNAYLDSKYVHVATMPPQQQKRFIEFLRQQSSARISIDTLEEYLEQWNDEVLEVFSMVDLVFVDSREHLLIEKLRGKDKVIKKGARGADYVHEGETLHVDAPNVSVVDKTGAGDVLAGAFLALRANGYNIQYALQEAVNLASESVTGFGIDFLRIRV